MQELTPDPKEFMELTEARMPFGKHKGWLLIDLPEPYIVWFRQKGFPNGKLGKQLEASKKKLANRNFVDKAPVEVVEEERNRVEELSGEIALLEKNLQALVA